MREPDWSRTASQPISGLVLMNVLISYVKHSNWIFLRGKTCRALELNLFLRFSSTSAVRLFVYFYPLSLSLSRLFGGQFRLRCWPFFCLRGSSGLQRLMLTFPGWFCLFFFYIFEIG